jgi:TRAP-type C4-dicarboxylate transport system permease large subunit
LFYCVVIWLVVRWQPGLAPASERSGWSERWAAVRRIWDMIVLVALVIGGIALGWVSPSEAAAIGAAGSLLIAALRRGLTRTMLFSAFEATLKTSGMIFLIIIGALVFSVFVGVTGLAEAASSAVTSMGLGPVGTLAVIALLLLALGSVLDGLALMLLTTPSCCRSSVDGHVGAVVRDLHHPRDGDGICPSALGMNLYVIQGVAKDVSIGASSRA